MPHPQPPFSCSANMAASNYELSFRPVAALLACCVRKESCLCIIFGPAVPFDFRDTHSKGDLRGLCPYPFKALNFCSCMQTHIEWYAEKVPLKARDTNTRAKVHSSHSKSYLNLSIVVQLKSSRFCLLGRCGKLGYKAFPFSYPKHQSRTLRQLTILIEILCIDQDC